MGQEVVLSCQKFRQFLQNPVGEDAFLKKLGTSEDIVFCGNNGSCVCMNGCGVYSGRLTPGYRSVKLVEVQKEDAKVEFMFHFEDPIGHQASRTCVFKIYPEICPGLFPQPINYFHVNVQSRTRFPESTGSTVSSLRAGFPREKNEEKASKQMAGDYPLTLEPVDSEDC